MTLIPISSLPPDVSVLNCGAGDMTFSFDEKDPLEAARAERVVKDMLARGYLLFAKVDGEYQRVTQFDAERREYIIADGPESSPAATPQSYATELPPEPAVKTTESKTAPKAKPAKRGRGRRVPAKGTAVTAIAPTAGG